jgi:transposase-like protein
VKEFFPDSVVQRCLVHKERNIRSKLSSTTVAHYEFWIGDPLVLK